MHQRTIENVVIQLPSYDKILHVMEDKVEIIEKGTEKKISQLQEKIELLQAKLTASTAQLTASESTVKELTSYKLRTEQLQAFKQLGGKEDYFDAYIKLNDELGEKPSSKTIEAFKTKYSNMFEITATTPTSAIAGQADDNTPKVEKGKLVDDSNTGTSFKIE